MFMWSLTTIKTSISMEAGGGVLGGRVGIDHYTMIQDGSFTMVCQDGMAECIPTGETTTITTGGEAIGGTTGQYLMVMSEPIGNAGKPVAIGGIKRIEARQAATITEWRPVGTSEVLHRSQGANRLRQRHAKFLRRQGENRNPQPLARLLISVRIKVHLGAWGEEATHKNRATVVTRAARACLRKVQAVGVRARLIVAVEATVGAKVMSAVPVKG
jgi:hypothetical protein